MSPRTRLLGAAVLLLVPACKNPRPVEWVNVTFLATAETDHYATWDFDLDACVDFNDPRVDDGFVREHLLTAIDAELAEGGYRRDPGGEVDFLVSYELFVADGGDLEGVDERARGRIYIRDVVTGKRVWRGERKAPSGQARSEEEQIAALHDFAHDLLQYTRKLGPPE